MDTGSCKLGTKLIVIMGLILRYAAGEDDYQQAIVLGDACEADIQCTKPFGSYAKCATREGGFGTCKCMANAHFKDGRCYETSLIGGKCKVHNNCYLASGMPAYCDKSECTCPNSHHPNQNGTDCIKTVYLDGPCQTDQECVTENSRCGDVCRCRVNYIQSRKEDGCLKAADKIGDPCSENEQCTMFLGKTTCSVEGHCSCLPGYHHIPPNSKCFPDIGLGGMCEDNAECAVPSAVCSAGICSCGSGLIPDDDNTMCTGDNGKRTAEHGLIVVLLSLALPRLFEYLKSST
ncbi:prion-like-(Q/N-rich) domain-bearing protein 25 isoform X2 [Zootermopsis nevadensis]|uniref:prion-like-(Q/N-rich) domain-bearing protein 25 isoform X2 n=1 Tax=Zootermopsis nevadensis TaxID=136037 RepID=UPI000B8E6C73|nr:prion-like-(Q/N-rich) domain-bearing protein 25 isoform X2 [Zootermopsis nevadensis]